MKKTTLKKPAAVTKPDPKPETPQPAMPPQMQLAASDNCFVRAQKIMALTGLSGLMRYGVDKHLAEVLQAYIEADAREIRRIVEREKAAA